MKLPSINEGIFKPHESPVKRRESSYILIPSQFVCPV